MLATTTNSFALVIDQGDPDVSPLLSFGGNMNTSPGLDSAGVNLLMESEDWLSLRFSDSKLQNDEFAGRQFLYPVPVPEPNTGWVLVVGITTFCAFARARASAPEKRR